MRGPDCKLMQSYGEQRICLLQSTGTLRLNSTSSLHHIGALRVAGPSASDPLRAESPALSVYPIVFSISKVPADENPGVFRNFIRSVDAPSRPYKKSIPAPAKIPTAPSIQPKSRLSNPVASLGCIFCVLSCPLALQLSVPHEYPLGQHPPPSPDGQRAHPFAQLPPPVVAAATVASPPLTTVVASCGGHDVVSQFRSTRQHPPR